MKNPAKLTINLLPKDPFLSTPLGRFLTWALKVGRYLVIFTELVVITSFGSRFAIDRQVTDLNVQIFEKQSIINSYGTLEQEVRTIQKKLSQYKQIQNQTNLADAFPALSEVTPGDVVLNELTIQPGRLTFEGSTLSQTSLNLLINNLQLSPRFYDVSVERIETGDVRDPKVKFRIQAKLRQTTTAAATEPVIPNFPGTATP